jgi:hypothetical protein
VDKSSLVAPVRVAVEKTLNRNPMAAISTPEEALEFLSNPKRGYEIMTRDEIQFLRDLKDSEGRIGKSKGKNETSN